MILGVDPGIGGAYAALLFGAEKDHTTAWDTPTVQLTKSKKTMDLPVIYEALKCLRPTVMGLEDVHAMPKQGVSSMFTFGKNVGQWEALAAAFKMRVIRVRPQDWKKEFGLLKKEKDAARKVAQELFPHLDLSKKMSGKSDALLIAEYVRRKGL